MTRTHKPTDGGGGSLMIIIIHYYILRPQSHTPDDLRQIHGPWSVTNITNEGNVDIAVSNLPVLIKPYQAHLEPQTIANFKTYMPI